MARKCDTMQRNDGIGRRRGATGEGEGGDDASWFDANLTGLKNKESLRDRFMCYKWMVKI
jgi:hypothetical protein